MLVLPTETSATQLYALETPTAHKLVRADACCMQKGDFSHTNVRIIHSSHADSFHNHLVPRKFFSKTEHRILEEVLTPRERRS
jgi:hypothetical protein